MSSRLETIWRWGSLRFLLLLGAYSCVLIGAQWMSINVRFDISPPAEFRDLMSRKWMLETVVNLVFLFIFGQFAGVLSYFSVPDLKRIVIATGTAALVTWGVGNYVLGSHTLPAIPVGSGSTSAASDKDHTGADAATATPGDPTSKDVKDYRRKDAIPRGVLLLDFILSTVGVVGIRLGLRLVRERYLSPNSRSSKPAKRVGILGAGDVGADLARELLSKRGLGLQPVAFFDDDKTKWRSQVHGIPVVGPPEILSESQASLALEEAIIAMPSAPAKRVGEIIRVLQAARIQFETVPSLHQLATGKVRVSKLRSVQIDDLLGRDPIPLSTDNIRQLLRDRTVAVTGAGGSIGSELCRQIASFDPKRLLLIEQAEGLLFQIEQELIEFGSGGTILPLVADVLDVGRMRYLLGRFRPDVIFHAAAHKHVPLMEMQPGEAIKNNTLGSAMLAELALEFQVDRFVMISTDKAINPTNVMGASKRLAECFVQALHAAHQGQTKFMAVRFGNVLGSSGSVIPTFSRQIASGGPVKVTHPEVTRYFMTIPEAVGLVLQSAAQGEGGEIFVLDMGKPVRIVDLARQMIELSGLRPDEDIQIEFVGLRPGEKLFEELSYQGENYAPTEHPKIMRFHCQPPALENVRKTLAELTAELHSAEANQLKLLLKKAVPEYQPYLT